MKRNKKKVIKTIPTLLLVLFLGYGTIGLYNHYNQIDNTNNIPILNKEESSNEISGLEYLSSLASSNKDISTIMKNKDDYPEVLLEMLSRNIDMTDYVLGYKEKYGKVYSKNIGPISKGIYPLLLQYDTRWGYGMYGDEVLAIDGCGPTSLAMVIAGLTGKNNITPYDVSKYAYDNGYYYNGTVWALFTKGVNNYGITGKEITLSKSSMMGELEDGHPIICSMRQGDFTTTGHIIVITGIKDNKFTINDPANVDRSNKLWSYEELEYQIRNLWSFKLK